ncbi:MAG TPA: hypothetical protein VGN37_09590 [Actinocatenispora sp.]
MSDESTPRPSPHLFGRGPVQPSVVSVPPEAAAETGELVPTGEPRVDGALTTLAGLAERPVSEQVAGYEEIHRALQDTLATVDDA